MPEAYEHHENDGMPPGPDPEQEKQDREREARLKAVEEALAPALEAAQRMEAASDPKKKAEALREARQAARQAEAALAPGVKDWYMNARAGLLPEAPPEDDAAAQENIFLRQAITSFRRELDSYTPPICAYAGEEANAEPVEPPLLWWDCKEQDGTEREAWRGQCFLHVGGVAVFSGEGEIGKTALAIQWGLNMAANAPKGEATGNGWLSDEEGERRYHEAENGHDPGDWQDATGIRGIGGPVVYASFEDRPPRIGSGAKNIGQAIEECGNVPETFHTLNMRDRYIYGPAMDNLRNATNAAPERAPEWFEFWARVRSAGARLVILDNAGYCFTSPGFQAVWVRQFIMALEEEAEAAGCGVLIIAHPAKHERATGGVAGSAAWTDAARAALSLRWPKRATARTGANSRNEIEAENKGARVLETIKSNYGPSFRLILEPATGRAMQRSASARFTESGNDETETQGNNDEDTEPAKKPANAPF